VKSRTKQDLMKQVNNQGSFTTTRNRFDTGTSYHLQHRAIREHLSIVLFLLLSLGAGLGTATAEAQTRAYVVNAGGSTVSVIDTATNTVVATIPVGGRAFWGSHHACATSSDEYKAVRAWWVSEVRSACRTFQESRAVRQLCRASLASGRKGVLMDAQPNTWRAPSYLKAQHG